MSGVSQRPFHSHCGGVEGVVGLAGVPGKVLRKRNDHPLGDWSGVSLQPHTLKHFMLSFWVGSVCHLKQACATCHHPACM